MDKEYEVKVSKQLEDLVPGFLENRRKDLELLRTALAVGDFTALGQIGHRLKGVGKSYGFEQISDVGKHVEVAAKDGDAAALAVMVEDYARYLSQLRVTFE